MEQIKRDLKMLGRNLKKLMVAVFVLISIFVTLFAANLVSASGGSIATANTYPEDGKTYSVVDHFAYQTSTINTNTTVSVCIDNGTLIPMSFQGLTNKTANDETIARDWYTWQITIPAITNPGRHTFQFFSHYYVWQETDQYWAEFNGCSINQSFIIAGTSSTQTTPSVPEFTVKFIGTFQIPLTSAILPSVNITIKNQPFTTYTDQHGNRINLYYVIQWKENSSNYWQQTQIPLNESNYDFTTTNLGLIRSGASPPTGVVNFQVEAIIGYITYIQGSVPQGEYIPPTYTGEFSGWSNTQSIIVTNSPTISSSSSVLQLSLTIYIVLVIVAVLLAGLVIVLYEKTKNS